MSDALDRVLRARKTLNDIKVPAVGDLETPKIFGMPELPKAYWFGQISSGSLSEVPIICLERSVTTFSQPRLEAVWQRLIRRHEMLRAIVRPDGTFEILQDPPQLGITVTDLRATTQEEAEQEVARIHDALLSRPRSLDKWPLFEVHAAQLPDGTTRLLCAFCVVTFDAYSWFILEKDANALYQNPSVELPPLQRTYAEYATFAMASESGPEKQRAVAYWEERLANLPRGPALPVLRTPGTKRWTSSEFRLSAVQAAGLKATARELGLSKYSLTTAAFAEAIATWTRSRHFVLTLLVQSRPNEFAPVIGNFSSTVALEVDFRGQKTFRERAREMHRRFLTDIEHRAASGIYVGREINRLSGRPPTAIFPVAFSTVWGPSEERNTEASCLGSYVRRRLRVPDISLDAGLVEHADGSVVCDIHARADMFPDGLLADLQAAFRRILVELAEGTAPADRVRPITPSAHDRALIAQMNRTETPVDPRLLHELFVEQAARTPHATAVIATDRSLTYAELDRESAVLAHRLRELGVGPNQLVAVAMNRGWQQVVAVLAIHRAGAAYVPIDLALVPHARMLHILRHAEVRVVLTQPEPATAVDWPADTTVIAVEPTDATPRQAPEQAWPRQQPEDLAYIIYTSGSTGLPKGVVIDHRGAVNTVVDINSRFRVTAQDRVLALSSLGFDLSVWDVFGTLAAGGALVMPPASERPDPSEWTRAARDHGVTIWNSVPKLLEITIEHISERRELWPKTLRLAMLSGDWIPVTLPDRARAYSRSLEVISLGGATEASIWSIYYPIDKVDRSWASIPYGRPMANQTFHVLDDAYAQRPVWVTGELYIGGIGLAKGYWRDEAKTSASFIFHPETGERLYRTGDFGRYLPDGNIEFGGREDSQIKVRGYRVELGEIEAVINRLPGVRETYVLAREATPHLAVERRRRVTDGAQLIGFERTVDKQLVAYVVPEPGVKLDVNEVRARVAEKVPEYMVPAFFVLLETSQIPRSANGKVNRRELPPPDELQLGSRMSTGRRPPRDALELKLHAVFARELGVDEVGIDDSFFELGGDSVMLVRVLSQIRKEYGREISVATFALEPRISSIARLLRDRPESAGHDRSLVTLRREGPHKPLFLMHPVGGSGLAYLALARHLEPVRPIYTLQARGLESDATPRATIEQMAAAYLAEIKAVQPHGPYLLGGWSLGGTIAFEMAGQLHEQREQAVVLMVDSWAPQGLAGSAPVPEDTLMEWFLRDVQQAAELAPGSRVARGTLSPTLQRQFAVYAANIRAVRAYVPRARPIKIALIRAATLASSFEAHPALRNPLLEDRVLGWNALTDQPVTLHTSPGDHYSMFGPDHITTLAGVVDECLRSLDGRLPAEGTHVTAGSRSSHHP